MPFDQESLFVPVPRRPGRWRFVLGTDELDRAAATLMDWMRAPGSGISLTDTSGRVFDHTQLGLVATEAVEELADGMRRSIRERRGLGVKHLVALASAAQNLGIVASVAVDAGAPTELTLELCQQIIDEVIVALDQRFVLQDDGTFATTWPAADRVLIEQLTDELEAALADPTDGSDDALVRLFPPAYGIDEEKSREYASLARDELVASRRASLDVLRQAIDRDTATAEELSAMMRAVNDLRLVIGTRLDVSEESELPPDDHPDAETWAIFEHLGHLMSQLIEALRSTV